MRITQILKLLLLTGLLTGCWTLHIKDETPETLGNIDLLQSFIGQKSESVVRELGLPDELLSDGDKQFMVYSARSSDTGFLVFIWLPVWAMRDSDNVLHCLRIELDSDNLVKEYLVKSKVLNRIFLGDVHFYSNCQEVFWIWKGSWKEPIKLQKATDFPSTWKEIEKEKLTEKEVKEAEKIAQELAKLELEANKGNSDAQLKLFKEVLSQDTNRALGWLCKSADLGNQEARSIMAKIYQYGGYTWIKKGVVQQDYKLSYLWHALSGLYDQEDLQFFADRLLNSAELSEAKNLLREWTPGQCERDLGLVSYTE